MGPKRTAKSELYVQNGVHSGLHVKCKEVSGTLYMHYLKVTKLLYYFPSFSIAYSVNITSLVIYRLKLVWITCRYVEQGQQCISLNECT